MTRGDEHHIADILDAAHRLEERLQLPDEAWVDDDDLRLITERLVEIIGEESPVRLTESIPEVPTITVAICP